MHSRGVSQLAIAAALAILVAGCGGGNGGGGPSGGPPITKPPPGPTLSGHVAIIIPNSTKQSKVKKSQSISPSSNSVSILVGSLAPQIADISASSPLCTPVSGGRSCNVPAVAPPGNDTFTITIFDGANATGNKLAVATFTLNVVAGQPWSASAVVSGVVSSVSVALTNAFLPAGTPGSTTMSVDAKDAGGNTIVGPYANTVALSASSGSVTLSPASLTQSGPPVTVNYDGSQTQNVTITASAGSGISSSATLSPTSNFSWTAIPTTNPFLIIQGPDNALYFDEIGPGGGGACGITSGLGAGKIARIDSKTLAITESTVGSKPAGLVFTPDGTLWNVNQDDNTIGFRTSFSGPYTVNTVPTASSDPRTITVGPDGNLWFTEISGNKVGTFSPNTPATITEFPLPTPNSCPSSIVSGPDGNLWLNEPGTNKVAKMSTAGAVTEYALPPSYPRFLAFSTDGTLYGTARPNTSVPFSPGVLAKVTTDGTVGQVALPPLTVPEGISSGVTGSIYITDVYWGSIGQLNSAGSLTLWPMSTIALQPTSPGSPGMLAYARDGSIWTTSLSSAVNPITSYVGHLLLAQGWSVFPQGPISMSASGNLSQQLIGIAETGDTGPFTVTSDTPAVVAASALSTSSHNFMLTGIAAGTATVTVTDKAGRSSTIPVTVTTGSGTVQSIGRRVQ